MMASAKTADPDPGRDDLGFLLAKATQRWNELLYEHFTSAGYADIRPSYGSVLLPLYEEDGLRMGELARRARLSKQTMTDMIRRLERDGLVERRTDPNDARASLIYLTGRSRHFQPVVATTLAGLDRLVREHLSAQRLDDLRSIPVELHLDDFGTGFSSLSYLHRYRLDALKIDQSFISRIGGLHNDAPIVGSIVNLARQLGMGVIAEGVETAQQAKHLLALDCPHAQGYLFSRPLTAAEARNYLANLPPLARNVPPPPQLAPRPNSRGEVHATMPRRIM